MAVHFRDKDEVKRLGGRWDVSRRVWFVPSGVSPEPFRKWMLHTDFQITAPSYYIARSVERCWKCKHAQYVYGLMLPPGYYEDDPDAPGFNSAFDGYVFLNFVTRLHRDITGAMGQVTQSYSLAATKTHPEPYYANHCEQCKAVFGDFFMHSEPGGAFFPMSAQDAKIIKLQHVDSSFAGDGAWSTVDAHMFHSMPMVSLIG